MVGLRSRGRPPRDLRRGELGTARDAERAGDAATHLDERVEVGIVQLGAHDGHLAVDVHAHGRLGGGARLAFCGSVFKNALSHGKRLAFWMAYGDWSRDSSFRV